MAARSPIWRRLRGNSLDRHGHWSGANGATAAIADEKAQTMGAIGQRTRRTRTSSRWRPEARPPPRPRSPTPCRRRRRPILAETEQIARDCPAEGLTMSVIVETIRDAAARRTSCEQRAGEAAHTRSAVASAASADAARRGRGAGRSALPRYLPIWASSRASARCGR